MVDQEQVSNPAQSRDYEVINNHWIELKCGRRLAARIWLPAGVRGGNAESPVPAIFEFLPYRKGDGTAPRDDSTYPVFAANGYAGVRVDIAGTGCSDGLMEDEYLEDELATGVEVIEWIADQEWCNGAVGMMGISWGGFNSLQIAMLRPPQLKAIVTVCSTVDRFNEDIHYRGGSLLTDNPAWSQQMLAYNSRSPDPTVVGDNISRKMWLDRLENMPLLISTWLGHQTRDEYWKHGSVIEDWDAIECATLAIGGWADAYTNAPFHLVEGLNKAPIKALVGPWEHKYPHIARITPTGDYHGEVLAWFDRWLLNKDNGADQLPDARVYIKDFGNLSADFSHRDGQWVAVKDWEQQRKMKGWDYALLSDGGLVKIGAETGKENKRMALKASPQHIGMAAGYFCPGMRINNELPTDQAVDDALSLCFDTKPLLDDCEVLGQPVLSLKIRADQPQGMIVARLCDVAPDGRADRISFGILNLNHHKSQENPTKLVIGQDYNIEIKLDYCGHRLKKGHKLRLALSTSYWPMVWPQPQKTNFQLDLSKANIHIPLLDRGGGNVHDITVDQARDYPRVDRRVMQEPASETSIQIADDGRHVHASYDHFGQVLDPTNDLINGSSVNQVYSIHPDDPLSAHLKIDWVQELKRGKEKTVDQRGWSIKTETGHEITSDRENFIIKAYQRAFENGQLIHEKYWDETSPRKYM